MKCVLKGFIVLPYGLIPMCSSLDNVEFLVRPESRVEVLDATHEAPRTRDELKQATDASRTTLSRMLADFEEQEWIVRRDG
jgi:predicted transcriptional regulator